MLYFETIGSTTVGKRGEILYYIVSEHNRKQLTGK